ncbi:MAG: hypothetical protein HDR41_04070 [Lactobacillus sp.]|nr:hypothetical protein [Lactobacillus sp.]
MPAYKFHDIGIYSGDVQELSPNAGITFNGFNSAKAGWWLVSRDLPTPEEYEVVDSVPYQQGEYDFSVLDNQRFFKPRTMKYEFYIIDDDPQYRQGSYDQGKNELMLLPYTSSKINNAYMDLLDTGSPAYKFSVKCKSVSASDDDEKGIMTVTVEFKGFPFALGRSPVGSDIWDEFDFDNHEEQQLNFSINGDSNLFALDNPGMPTPVTILAGGNLVLRWPGEDANQPTIIKGNTTLKKILPSGFDNRGSCNGTGSLRLVWNYRMMF